MSYLYSVEKNLENRVAIHAYTVKFKYIPKSLTLYGSNNHMCWFILDEVFDFSKVIQINTYTLNCTINNNSYFRFFKIEAETDSSKANQTLEILFDETDFDDSPFFKITDPSFSIQSNPSISPDYSKAIGLLEALIINNFHIFITTHRSDYSNQQDDNSIQNYSIFSNYIKPKIDLKTFDPRPKGNHEFIFHSFFLQIDTIFFKNKETELIFYIEYLDSNQKWNHLIHTKTTTAAYSLNKDIYGLRFNTTKFGFKDFDFYGLIQFSEKAEIIPSTFSGFPFWGTNLNGIINGLKQFTLVDPTSSGLFNAVGQFDLNDDSQKSFLREMHTIFEDYNESTSSITFRFGFKIRLSNYLVQVPERAANERNRNPHKWKLEGSNDEINWILLSEVEDNIFDTDVEGVVYNTTNTSDYFSSFRIVKFDDCHGFDNVRFNQLILYRIEFFGIISPFFSPPSFFWELPISRNLNENSPYSHFEKDSNVQPIIPIDLCNGILGCLNYFGFSIDQSEAIFNFKNFFINLVAMALINPPDDLNIILSVNDSECSTITLINFNETNPIKINENVYFIKFPIIKYGINKVSLSKKIDGIELFGLVSNDLNDDSTLIKPGNFFEFNFPLNFKFDILHSLIISEFPDFNFESEIETSYFTVQATKPLIIQDLSCQIIESTGEKFILFDFVDSRLSLNFFAICSEKLESLVLKGSNDGGKTYENVLDFKSIHQNHDLKTFFFKSRNCKPFKLFRLEKTKSYKAIENVKFYGKLELIKHRMRKPKKLKALENFSISPGLDSQNGILNAFKNFPLEKVKLKDVFTIDFIEILIIVDYFSLISFNDSNNTNYLKVEGFNNQNEWVVLFDEFDKDLRGDVFLCSKSDSPISVLKITTDDKNFDFDKIEIFGDIIVSRPNPIRKKPPNFEFMLNPFNGILNSGLFEFKQTSHFHYSSIEFENNIQIFVNKIFLEFNDALKNDFFIEASNDSLNWKKIDFDLNKASLKKFECSMTQEGGYRIFHFFSKSNFNIKRVELFGRVQKLEDDKKSDTDITNRIELSSEKLTTFSYYNDHPLTGIFYSISHFFSSLSIPFSLNGTKGNEENALSLFDTFSDGIVSFTSTQSNVICLNLKLAKVKLTNYSICFGPDLLPNSNTANWKLEVSNDKKKWIEIDSQNFRKTKEIETFQISDKNNENGYFYHFRFLFKNSIVLRKIEFFGDYMPNSQDENFAIVKNHPVILRKNVFSGILTSMCKVTNAFDKGFVIASPQNLSKLFDSKNNESVTIDSIASFEFVDSELILSYYSIETTMKNWKVEVKSSKDEEKWIEIHSQTNFQNCNTFKILNCPIFSKIRFINNDKKPQKLKRIEFFGSITDTQQTKSFRYDIMNGLLSLLAPHSSSVFNREMTVKSSDYKYTNPIQIFDRIHINRIFCFIPSTSKYDDESKLAYLVLEFWKKAIKIDNFSIILLMNSKIKNLKIEGAISLDSENRWEEIRYLNEDEIKGNNFLFIDSKSSKFFHFIRISSTDQFSFENIEFFGDYKVEVISKKSDNKCDKKENLELDDKDVISRFPLMPLKSPNKVLKKGFFHDEKVNFEGFVQIKSTQLAKNSSHILSIFTSGNTKGAVVFEKKNPIIKINFLTTSFQLTHFFIETKNKTKIEVIADDKTVFQGDLPNEVIDDDDDSDDGDDQISIKNVISLHHMIPSKNFSFKFQSEKNLEIGFFEIYGNLMPNNGSPDHLISLGLNRIKLSFKNCDDDRLHKNFSLMHDRLKFDFFKSGILSSIAKNNGGSLDDSCIVTAYERYPEIERSIVHARKSSPSEYAFGNSPQVTFDFGNCILKLSDYALESEMRSWIVEGSYDGESWFILDKQSSKNEGEERPKTSSPRFARKHQKKKEDDSTISTEKSKEKLFTIKSKAKKREVSMIRITNMDAFFEGYYDTTLFYSKKSDNSSRYSCGIGRIEFYGDIDVRLPNQIEKKNEEKDNEINSFIDYEDDYDVENSKDDNKCCKPTKNLIFFPPFSVPNLQLDEESPSKELENNKDSDSEYYYDDYEIEYEEILEDPELSCDESVSYSSSDNTSNGEHDLNILDFSNLSIADLLRIFRNAHSNQSSEDLLDLDLDLSD